MKTAITQQGATRVIFGSGTIERVADEADELCASRIVLLSSPTHNAIARRVTQMLEPRIVGRFDGAQQHTPHSVSDEALQFTTDTGADLIVAIGGGTVTGLSKSVAHRTGVDQLVVPTTYAGSEMTNVVGETIDGVKTTIAGPQIQPETVIYDVNLTVNLPVPLSITSAINAMAHAVEALYSPEANPVTDSLALDAIARIGRALPVLANDPTNAAARTDLLRAAWFAGTCLGSVGMGLHHKLCHVLGGALQLPHSAVHTVLLPRVMAFNAPEAGEVMHEIAAALDGDDAPCAVYDLVARVGGPQSLKALGVEESSLGGIAVTATSAPYPNPRTATTEAVVDLLELAWRGARPPSPPNRARALTAQVRASFDGVSDHRTRSLLTSLVHHLHDFVVDNGLTESEWAYGIDFLTATGQMCTDLRQEFVLLSDTLGVSSMVDLLSSSRTPGATPSAVLGPFYTEGPPEAELGANIAEGLSGVPLWVHVRVVDTDGTPIIGAVVDVWQSNDDGFYDIQLPDVDGPVLRARFRTDSGGCLNFRSILPREYPIPDDGPVGKMLRAVGRHPYRAPHLHFMIQAPGYPRLVTQLFVAGGDYLESDSVFGVKDDLVVDFAHRSGTAPDGSQPSEGWRQLDYTFRIAKCEKVAARHDHP